MKKSPKRTQREFLHLREVLPEFSKDTLPETLGSWCVEASERGICSIFWHQSNVDLITDFPNTYPHILAIVDEARRQITEYLRGWRRTFNIPIESSGSEFQQRVWAILSKIPYGQTCSYKELAIEIGRPQAYRAVANACSKNPIHLIIPCHRVIATNGSLCGYAGGVAVKKFLLELENRYLIYDKR